MLSMRFLQWIARKFQATVLNDIWFEILFFTGIATMVATIHLILGKDLSVNNQMLTVTGTVLGLVVSFRTSSAYERFMEGRKLWTDINLVSRNLAHVIWLHVPADRDERKQENGEISSTHKEPSPRLKVVIEKKSMINLVQAFSVSVKHMLRGEAGIFYDDLYPLVCFLPKYASHPPHINPRTDILPLWQAVELDDPSVPKRDSNETPAGTLTRTTSAPGDQKEEKAMLDHVNGEDFANALAKNTRPYRSESPDHILPVVNSERPLRPARNPPKETLYDYIPVFLLFKPIIWVVRAGYRKLRKEKYQNRKVGDDHARDAFGRKKKAGIVESSVPLEITLHLSSYLSWLLRKGYIEAPFGGSFNTYLEVLQSTMANLDRVRTTPIPYAYQAHLRMSMWLYLIFLPFETIQSFGWFVIPATAFGAFLLLGFMEIGQEIEDPFGYDHNDLNLDTFCDTIRREISEIVAHPTLDPETFVFQSCNYPFAPADNRNAKEIIDDVEHDYHGPRTGMLTIRRALLRSYRKTAENSKIKV